MAAPALNQNTRTNKIGAGYVLAEYCQRYAAMSTPHAKDTERLKELFYSAIHKADLEARKTIAVTLSNNPNVPKTIIMFLGLQDISIATPVLLCSPVLEARDLMSLIERTSREHAEIIARRDHLPDPVVFKLLEADIGKGNIRSLLVRNPSSQKAKLEFTRAKPVAKQHRQPLNKPDISTPVELTEKEAVHSKDLSDQLLQMAKPGKANQRPSRVIRSGENALSTNRLFNRLAEAARDDNYKEFSFILELERGLDREMLLELVDKRNAGLLACVFRAIEFSRSQAGRLLLLILPELGRNADIYRQVMDKFEEQPLDAALEILDELRAPDGQSSQTITKGSNQNLSRLLENRRQEIHNASMQSVEIESDQKLQVSR